MVVPVGLPYRSFPAINSIIPENRDRERHTCVHLLKRRPFGIEIAVHVLLLQTVSDLEVLRYHIIKSDPDIGTGSHDPEEILFPITHSAEFVLYHRFEGINRRDFGSLLIDQITTFPDKTNGFVDYHFRFGCRRVCLSLSKLVGKGQKT